MSEPRFCLEHGEFWSVAHSGCPVAHCKDDGLEPREKVIKLLRAWLDRAKIDTPDRHWKYDFDLGPFDCHALAIDIQSAIDVLEKRL